MPKDMRDDLSQRLFGDNAVLVTAHIADHRDSLYPSELAIISGAIEKRALEFSTGRYCAHQALRALVVDNFPVLRGKLREPVWPENIVGSISHCRDIAGAAIASTSQVRSIGLDIENRKQINPDIARHVCTEKENNWLQTLVTSQRNDAILQIFSIKEAVFKCIYQASGAQLRFTQCQITHDMQNNIVKAIIQNTELPIQQNELTVYSYFTETHIFSSAIWHYLPAVG